MWCMLPTYAMFTLACNWDGVCVYSDRACWEFSQKFHAVIKVSFLRLWVSDPVQSPVTKCPHLYLNCRRAWPCWPCNKLTAGRRSLVVGYTWSAAIGNRFMYNIWPTSDKTFQLIFSDAGPALNLHWVNVSCLLGLDKYNIRKSNPIVTRHWSGVVLMLCHRLRRWPTLKHH